MDDTAEKAPRPPNPKCVTCSHPRSFHAKPDTTGTRPCSAFGCQCADLVLEETE